MDDILSELGLRLTLRPLVVELGEGVKLTGRSPISDDWALARAEVAKVFSGVEALAQASAHYGWDRIAQLGMADARTWEARAERCLMQELAALTVERIERGDIVLEGPFPARAFTTLFTTDAYLATFSAKVKEADHALIAAKKGSEPSSDISGRAAGSTATDAPD